MDRWLTAYLHRVQRVRSRLARWAHTLGRHAHRWEHPFHLAYFGGLSTGFLDYHLIAAGCLIVGLLAMLPIGDQG